MRPLTSLLVVVAALGSATWPSAAARADEVIPLKVEAGGMRPGRDARVFSVPVVVNGVEARFQWGCGGWTTVSESFARKAGLEVVNDAETADVIDGEGKPLFLGKTRADIVFGGRRTFCRNVKVQRDADYNKGFIGVLGFDVASQFQWELDPDPEKPTLTLRPPGSKVEGPVVATLPMKEDRDNLWITIKARNTEVEVLLIPQSTDTQAAPDLQKAWDIATGEEADKGVFGAQRVRTLGGARDYIEFTPEVREPGITVVLIGDKDNPDATPDARSGLGASLLNRYTYRVDPKLLQFTLVRKSKPIPARK